MMQWLAQPAGGTQKWGIEVPTLRGEKAQQQEHSIQSTGNLASNPDSAFHELTTQVV